MLSGWKIDLKAKKFGKNSNFRAKGQLKMALEAKRDLWRLWNLHQSIRNLIPHPRLESAQIALFLEKIEFKDNWVSFFSKMGKSQNAENSNFWDNSNSNSNFFFKIALCTSDKKLTTVGKKPGTRPVCSSLDYRLFTPNFSPPDRIIYID